MSSRHQPLNGADSPEDFPADPFEEDVWAPRPFSVVMEDWDHDRIKLRIPAAIGRHDAENQARDLRPDYMVVHVEEEAA